MHHCVKDREKLIKFMGYLVNGSIFPWDDARGDAWWRKRFDKLKIYLGIVGAFSRNHPILYMEDDTSYAEIANLLYNGVVFIRTEEGYEYWMEFYQVLLYYEKGPPVPLSAKREIYKPEEDKERCW